MSHLGTPEQRFFRKLRQVGDCWEWTGAKDPDGYGQFCPSAANGDVRLARAHRWVYEFMVAPIPPGLTIDHLCRNRACQNPWHMEPVPSGVNVSRANALRAWEKREFCKRGLHRLDESARVNRKTGSRQCRPCVVQRRRERRQEIRDRGGKPK